MTGARQLDVVPRRLDTHFEPARQWRPYAVPWGIQFTDESTRTISVVDLVKARASGFGGSAVIGQIPVGRAPIALTFSNDHRFLYTTSQIAPPVYGWPSVCTAPGSDAARQ